MASFKALSALLNSFGALWLSIEISTFFFSNTKLPNIIRESWLYFVLAGMIIAIYICRPQLAVSRKLNGRDVIIEIAIGDLFEFSSDLIIGSNTTFDTHISNELISAESVQGAFTRKYYSDESQLDLAISASLANTTCTILNDSRLGKTKQYPMGTCVKLNHKSQTMYLIAIANINEHGVASGSFNDLKESLSKLWVFIGQRGRKKALAMPILGTGFTRLKQTREEVIRETIKSFVAACSEMTFVDKLTIVITPHDIAKCGISLNDLGAFLYHECQYASFATEIQQPIGTPVP